MHLQLFLSVTPREIPDASRYTRDFVHAAYRIGSDSTLLRQELLLETRGGLLSVEDQDAPLIGDAEKLAAAVLRECARRSYTGAVLDFARTPSADRTAFAALLAGLLNRSRRTLFVTEPYALPGAVTLINTAISGGSFAERLRDAQTRYGRIALDVQRLRMDFSLPAPSGEGTTLTGEQLDDLLKREAPAVFFSQELCTRYFTYQKDGEAHFVLYDDEETLRRKLRIGSSMNIGIGFLLYPEVRDLLSGLFKR
jgi:hypothetical protein